MATLKAKRYVWLKQNSDGRVLHKQRFNRGDDVSVLPQEEQDRLARLGYLNEESEVDDGGTTENVEPPATPSGTPEVPEGQGEPAPEPRDYESVSFADLQQEAKERTGDGSGSKEALVARLREQDEKDAAE